MPTVKFTSSYETDPNTVVSVSSIADNELFGIDLVDSKGNPIPESSIVTLIKSAEATVETLYTIKLKKQVINEEKNFRIKNLHKNRFIKLTYPFLKGVGVKSKINDVDVIVYADSTMVSTKPNAGGAHNDIPRRNVNILPSSQAGDEVIRTSGAFELALDYFYYNQNYQGVGYNFTSLPGGWKIEYLTPGFGGDPMLQEYIRKKVAVDLLGSIGENVGQGVGIAQRSLSVDGLSQSVQTTSSATSSTFGARILQIKDELKTLNKTLSAKYLGIQLNKF